MPRSLAAKIQDRLMEDELPSDEELSRMMRAMVLEKFMRDECSTKDVALVLEAEASRLKAQGESATAEEALWAFFDREAEDDGSPESP